MSACRFAATWVMLAAMVPTLLMPTASAGPLCDWLFGNQNAYTAGYAPYVDGYRAGYGTYPVGAAPVYGSTPYVAGYAPSISQVNYLAPTYAGSRYVGPAAPAGSYRIPSVAAAVPQTTYRLPATNPSVFSGAQTLQSLNVPATNATALNSTDGSGAYYAGRPAFTNPGDVFIAPPRTAAVPRVYRPGLLNGLGRFFGRVFGTDNRVAPLPLAYQSNYGVAPVTYYRPMQTVSPISGQQVTVQQPCTGSELYAQTSPYASSLAMGQSPVAVGPRVQPLGTYPVDQTPSIAPSTPPANQDFGNLLQNNLSTPSGDIFAARTGSGTRAANAANGLPSDFAFPPGTRRDADGNIVTPIGDPVAVDGPTGNRVGGLGQVNYQSNTDSDTRPLTGRGLGGSTIQPFNPPSDSDLVPQPQLETDGAGYQRSNSALQRPGRIASNSDNENYDWRTHLAQRDSQRVAYDRLPDDSNTAASNTAAASANMTPRELAAQRLVQAQSARSARPIPSSSQSLAGDTGIRPIPAHMDYEMPQWGDHSTQGHTSTASRDTPAVRRTGANTEQPWQRAPARPNSSETYDSPLGRVASHRPVAAWSYKTIQWRRNSETTPNNAESEIKSVRESAGKWRSPFTESSPTSSSTTSSTNDRGRAPAKRRAGNWNSPFAK